MSAYNDVECVTSISDAVNRFVSMDFTLVILDANMSMEDDHKLLKVMRQAKRTPILLQTKYRSKNILTRLQVARIRGQKKQAALAAACK